MENDTQGFVEAGDGTRLFYEVHGQRKVGTSASLPKVVLCDGIGCDGFVWKYLQPHLAAHTQVIHWHYRGHGRSALPEDPARIDIVAHARDLLTVIDQLAGEPCIVIGHSMGTQVALEAFRMNPQVVCGLVLVCGTYGKLTSTFHGSDVLAQVLPGVIAFVEKHRALARALWGRIPPKLSFQLARLSREVDGLTLREDDFRWYIEHVAAMDPGIFLAMLKLAGEHSAEDVLERIHVPTLVVAAERDTFTPMSLAKNMADRIDGAEFFLLVGGSHAAPVEQRDVFTHKVFNFLDEHFATNLSGEFVLPEIDHAS